MSNAASNGNCVGAMAIVDTAASSECGGRSGARRADKTGEAAQKKLVQGCACPGSSAHLREMQQAAWVPMRVSAVAPSLCYGAAV